MKLVVFLFWLGFQALTPGTALVQGTVVDAVTGLPVVGSEVQLRTGCCLFSEGIFASSRSAITVRTDPAGRFVFDAAPGDNFRLGARAEGYQMKAYGDPVADGDPVVAVDDFVAPIVIRLSPASAISGRVTDSEGDPVTGLPVILLASRFDVGQNLRRLDETLTDVAGWYRFADLRSAEYFVLAGNPHGSYRVASKNRDVLTPGRFAWTFYPGVDDPDLAAAIRLSLGIAYGSAHLVVSPAEVHEIQGRAFDTETGESPESADVDLVPDLPFFSPIGPPIPGLYDADDGTFTFSDVADGRYRVGVSVPEDMNAERGNGPIDDWVVVEVSGRDVEKVELFAPRYTTVTGRIKVAGRALSEADPPIEPFPDYLTREDTGPRVVLQATGSVQPQGSINARSALDDGTFSVPNAVHGAYRLNVEPLPGNYYVESARLNGIPIVNSLVDIPRGIPSVLDIDLSPNGGEIHTRLQDFDGKPKSLTAVLLPDPIPPVVGTHRHETVVPDVEGAIVFKGVAPGSYRLFLWDPEVLPGDPDPVALRRRQGDAARVMVESGGQVRVDVDLLD